MCGRTKSSRAGNPQYPKRRPTYGFHGSLLQGVQTAESTSVQCILASEPARPGGLNENSNRTIENVNCENLCKVLYGAVREHLPPKAALVADDWGEYSTVEMALECAMRDSAELVHSHDRMSDTPEGVPARVQKALDEILKSGPFRGSKQSQQLLQYIVDRSLAGHLEQLKERIIGAEVFGRPLDYDTNQDPIVRARAAEVRKRLAQYYVGEGSGSSFRVEISPGSYHATFPESGKARLNELDSGEAVADRSPAAPDAIPQAESADASPSAIGGVVAHRSRRWWIVAAVLSAVFLTVLAYSFRPRSVLEQFWSPLLDTPKPVLIYTGANPVYMPSPQLIERYKATHHLSDLDTEGHEFLVPVSEDQKLGAGDLMEMKNEFLTLGDVSANVSVASLLTHFNRTFDLRSGEDVAFGDLRQSPAILIGAFNNAWTLQMTGDLPFVFGSGLTIKDQSDQTRQWRPVYSSENKVQLDYAVVARLPHSRTGGALIAIAGITQCGTRAAAELITSPEGVRELLRTAPAGWANRNLEFVLQTKVVNNIPTTPTVVALRAW